jgi:cytochrome c biogenesis protein CcmG/thiol:disulfide interchange protein DsbE
VKRFLVPLVVFIGLVVFLAAGLSRDPHEVPSPLIGRAAPAFDLPRLGGEGDAGAARFTPADMRGKVWLLNVWASWCVSCREEHPVLLEIARRGDLPLVGLDYKDTLPEARAWLAQHGNPYLLTAVDADGRVGIDYGVYGVPETYLIDQAGTIRFKQIGPLTTEVLAQTILPMAKELRR